MARVICLASAILWLLAEAAKDAEFAMSVCQSDYLRVKCSGPSEVIVMKRAEYGRMKMGVCVRENFGYVGCASDVLSVVDGQCSGRRDCSLRVLDENFLRTKPCHEDLKSYLEVHYVCVPVFLPVDRRPCQQRQSVSVRHQSAYLSNLVSAETGCGTSDSPWAIQVLPGQRINLTLLDFAWAASTPRPSGRGGGVDGAVEKVCRVYATVRETAKSRRSMTVCGGEGRTRPIHVTTGNAIEVRLITTQHSPKSAYFLLRYEAVGCPELTPPSSGWVKQTREIAVLGCSDSADTWQLMCHVTLWVGMTQNCSEAKTEAAYSEKGRIVVFPRVGLTVSIVVALALATWLLIVIVGIFCSRSLRIGSVTEGSSGPRVVDSSSTARHWDRVHKDGQELMGSRRVCGPARQYDFWPRHSVVHCAPDGLDPLRSAQQRSRYDDDDCRKKICYNRTLVLKKSAEDPADDNNYKCEVCSEKDVPSSVNSDEILNEFGDQKDSNQSSCDEVLDARVDSERDQETVG